MRAPALLGFNVGRPKMPLSAGFAAAQQRAAVFAGPDSFLRRGPDCGMLKWSRRIDRVTDRTPTVAA
jgi:hypothetical protein